MSPLSKGLRVRAPPTHVAPNLGKESPGPAADYKYRSSIRDKNIGFGRKDFIQASFLSHYEIPQRNKPPPANYNPRYDLTEASRFNKIGFGIGMKFNPLLFASSAKPVPSEKGPLYVQVPESEIRYLPGPGQYKIPSKFDKY